MSSAWAGRTPLLRLAAAVVLCSPVACRSSLRFSADGEIGPLTSGLEPGATSSVPGAPVASSASSGEHPVATLPPTAPMNVVPRDAGVPVKVSDASVAQDWPFDVAQPLVANASADAGRLVVPAAIVTEGELRIDGELLDWSEQAWFRLQDFVAQPGPAPSADTDLHAVFALRGSAGRLYVAVAVRDDDHVNTQSGFSIFEGDSVQIAFTTSDSEPYAWEYGLALTQSGPVARSWLPHDEDLTHNLPFAISRRGSVTSYEWAFVAERVGQSMFTHDAELRFGLIVNEADAAEGRSGFLQLVPGIGQSPKSGADFVSIDWLQ